MFVDLERHIKYNLCFRYWRFFNERIRGIHLSQLIMKQF